MWNKWSETECFYWVNISSERQKRRKLITNTTKNHPSPPEFEARSFAQLHSCPRALGFCGVTRELHKFGKGREGKGGKGRVRREGREGNLAPSLVRVEKLRHCLGWK